MGQVLDLYIKVTKPERAGLGDGCIVLLKYVFRRPCSDVEADRFRCSKICLLWCKSCHEGKSIFLHNHCLPTDLDLHPLRKPR